MGAGGHIKAADGCVVKALNEVAGVPPGPVADCTGGVLDGLAG